MEDEIAEQGPRASRLDGSERPVAEVDGQLTEKPDPQRPLVDAGYLDTFWRRWCPHDIQFLTDGRRRVDSRRLGQLSPGKVAPPFRRRCSVRAPEPLQRRAATGAPATRAPMVALAFTARTDGSGPPFWSDR
jgi:hypothetical protein